MILLVLRSAPIKMDELERDEPAVVAEQSTRSSDTLQLVRNLATLVWASQPQNNGVIGGESSVRKGSKCLESPGGVMSY